MMAYASCMGTAPPPVRAIRCDINDINPTAHGDGIAQIVNNLKEIRTKPPVMGPGMRQRAGCYFGAIIWWEAIRYNDRAIALDSWDMIWKAAQDIKSSYVSVPDPPNRSNSKLGIRID